MVLKLSERCLSGMWQLNPKTAKKIALRIAFLALIALFPLLSYAGSFVEGEILVKYKEGIRPQGARRIIEKHRLEKMEEFRALRIHRYKVPKGRSVREVIEELKKDPDVEYAEPNFKRRPLFVPNDEDFSLQWNLYRISAPSAWDFEDGSREVIVAVLDTGVDYTHPDIAKNIWRNEGEIEGNGIDDDGNGKIDDVHGWDFCPRRVKNDKGDYVCDEEGDNDPMDLDGHGTAVAGIIGALTNNLKGIAGVSPRVSILPIKFMEPLPGSSSPEGDVATEIKAIDYAIKMGAKIINVSYGDTESSQAEYDAIAEASKKGVLFVCASGNTGSTEPIYPASYNLPNIISVAATTKNDGLSSFSNYGDSVHIAAPGEELCSTTPQAASTYKTAWVEVDGKEIMAYGMEFSGFTKGLSGGIIFCGKAKREEIPDQVTGKIALIERGDITFREKVLNVMEKGAIGAIIYDNTSNSLPFQGTLLQEGEYVPAVSVGKKDGEYLKSLQSKTVKLVNYPFTCTIKGTSFATPHVSGTLSLLLSLRPKADAQVLKDAILSSADKIPSLEGKIQGGRRLNVLAALEKIKNEMPYEFTLRLKKDWNFVSIPLTPSQSSIETIFANVKPKVVYTYDNKEKIWLRYRSEASDTLTTLEAGRGYWIYMDQEAQIVLQGEKARRKARLYNGWNLVGYSGDDGESVLNALSGLGEKWVIVWSWDGGSWYQRSRFLSLPFPDLYEFLKGKAYWILLTGLPNEGIEWLY